MPDKQFQQGQGIQPESYSIVDPESGTSLDLIGTGFIVVVYVLLFVILIPVLLVATGLRIDQLIASEIAFVSELRYIGIVLMITGVLIMFYAMGQLIISGNGLPISHLPPKKLVLKGLYRHIRHIIYTGFILFFAGLACIFESIGMFLFSQPFMITGVLCYIYLYEEPNLVKRFGEQYRAYHVNSFSLVPYFRLPSIMRFLQKQYRRILEYLTRLANTTILYRNKDVILVNYGLFCAIGISIVVFLTSAGIAANGITGIHNLWYISGTILSGLIGARIFWWAGNFRYVKHQRLFGLLNTGFVSWGAAFLMIAYALGFSYFNGYSFFVFTDSLFTVLFIGYAIGRLGCVSFGCCYGKPVKKFGILYENPHAKVIREKGNLVIPRHPVQFYSSVHGLILFFILYLLSYQELTLGAITGFSFILYGWGRFILEFWRDRKQFNGTLFTAGHMGAVALFLLGWLVLYTITPDSDAQFMPLNVNSILEVIIYLPVIITLGILVFVVMGLHRKHLGSW